ncbi:MAG: hypothetical protein IPF99_36350 [Deltaproteobacteria bacterium]|nr:hypothetical protein [Deltaproteobacteria bacterium]
MPTFPALGGPRAALDAARTAHFSSEEWEAYDRVKVAEQDARGALSFARAEGQGRGQAEGKAEGRAEGKAEGRASRCWSGSSSDGRRALTEAERGCCAPGRRSSAPTGSASARWRARPRISVAGSPAAADGSSLSPSLPSPGLRPVGCASPQRTMKYGVRLHDDPPRPRHAPHPRGHPPSARAAPWTELRPRTRPARRRAPRLHRRLPGPAAQGPRPRRRARHRRRLGALIVHPYRPARIEAPLHWDVFRVRLAPTLWEAVRPLPRPGDPVPHEACFHAARDGGGAHRTIERLLALGRDDATVTELSGDALLIQLTAPPLSTS